MPNYNQYKVPTTLRSGGYVDIHSSAITVTYDMPYYAISTSPFNGGLHHVMAVRNQQLTFSSIMKVNYLVVLPLTI